MTTPSLRSAWPVVKNSLLLLLAGAAPFMLVQLGIKLQETIPTMGVPDAGIWQLTLISALNFAILSALAWWMLQRVWISLGLPKIQYMVSQFKQLTLWQQFAFYWASFALLLWAAVQCLSAVF